MGSDENRYGKVVPFRTFRLPTPETVARSSRDLRDLWPDTERERNGMIGGDGKHRIMDGDA